ncbi:hypothetical protein ACSBR1_039986 [Camellia fascicularis]
MHSISFGSLFFAISSKEIALLSQFEHESIVQYYGTDKGKKRKDMICIALVDDTHDQSKIRMNNVVITPFKTQTRIWLGEVLHKRLHDQLTISDLLADGELLVVLSTWPCLVEVIAMNFLSMALMMILPIEGLPDFGGATSSLFDFSDFLGFFGIFYYICIYILPYASNCTLGCDKFVLVW